MTTTQTEAKPARTANKLDTKQTVQLSVIVTEQFADRKQSDGDFALYASEKLGFKITAGNIQGMREAFGIPSSREVAALQNPDMLVKRVEELERTVFRLREMLNLKD